MNDKNCLLLRLLTECQSKMETLSLLCPDHELTQYDVNLSFTENTRLLSRLMKRFCPGAKNPAMPTKLELFIALRGYIEAVDAAISVDLIESIQRVLPQGVVIKDPDLQAVLAAFNTFWQTVDGIGVTHQSEEGVNHGTTLH